MKNLFLFCLSFCIVLMTSCKFSTSTSVTAPIETEQMLIYAVDNQNNTGAQGVRGNPNSVCENFFPAGTPPITCNNYVALLGYTVDNGVQDLPTNYAVPEDAEVINWDETVVATDFEDLIDDIDTDMTGTNLPSTVYFTGFENGGAVDVGVNCTDWTNGGAADASMNNITAGSSWGTTHGSNACSADINFLCLCWE